MPSRQWQPENPVSSLFIQICFWTKVIYVLSIKKCYVPTSKWCTVTKGAEKCCLFENFWSPQISVSPLTGE